jgi:hypothetical protein
MVSISEEAVKPTQRHRLDLLENFLCSFTCRFRGDVDVELKLGHATKVKQVLGIAYAFEDGKVGELGVTVASVTGRGPSGIFIRSAAEDDRDERRCHSSSCVEVFLHSR